MKMKKILTLTIVLVSSIILSGCSINKEIKKDEFKDNQVKEDFIKNELVKKYNPVVFDDENFLFSKNIQIKIDKDFLLYGTIDDVYDKGEKTFIYFSSTYLSDFFGTFEINDDQEKFILDEMNNKDSLNEFFVIVKIEDVSKPLFKIKGEIDDDYIQIDTSAPDSFILEGKLIDIKKEVEF